MSKNNNDNSPFMTIITVVLVFLTALDILGIFMGPSVILIVIGLVLIISLFIIAGKNEKKNGKVNSTSFNGFQNDNKEKVNNSSSKINNELEKKMSNYNLEEWEKEEVRKGHADITSFEEDDTEDGDYYDEDDK